MRAVGGVGAAFIVLYLAVALLRVAHPFELEWMEGAVTDHVRRVLDGAPLYVAPSPDFVPFIYPPLYFWIAAGAASLGVDLLSAMRATSLVASLAVLGALYLLVRREGAARSAAVGAAGLYAACYAESGGWMDIGRVDSLFLALTLLGAVALHRARGPAGDATAAILFCAAFLAKQPAAIVAIPLSVYAVATREGWSRLVFPLTTTALIALAVSVGDAVSDGWFSFYTLELPLSHEGRPEVLHTFWWRDVALTLGGVVALAVWAVRAAGTKTAAGSPFIWALLAGLLAVSWSSRWHAGGYVNVLMPAHAALAIVFATSLDAIHRAAADRTRVRVAASALAIAQLAWLAYDPRDVLPSNAHASDGEHLVEVIESYEGPVMIPSHGGLAHRIGKQPFAHIAAVHDVWRGGDRAVAAQLERAYEELFAGGSVPTLILDDRRRPAPAFYERVRRHYRPVRPVFERGGAFAPVTAWPSRPSVVWRHRSLPDPEWGASR